MVDTMETIVTIYIMHLYSYVILYNMHVKRKLVTGSKILNIIDWYHDKHVEKKSFCINFTEKVRKNVKCKYIAI